MWHVLRPDRSSDGRINGGHDASEVFPGAYRWPVYGVFALVATKSADLLTTVIGVSNAGVVELNPLVRASMQALGTLPGLFLVGTFSITLLVSITESYVLACRELEAVPQRYSRLVRTVGYGLPSTINLVVATHNVVLLTLA